MKIYLITCLLAGVFFPSMYELIGAMTEWCDLDYCYQWGSVYLGGEV